MAIADLTSELYGLAPEEFTAARDAMVGKARGSGDRELAAAVRALRKPSVGAWVLNQLVRRRRDEVEQVLDLGARLRAAQGTLGAAELRALDGERRRLTRAVAEQGVALAREAGRTVSAQVVSEVEETLRSAMVDPAAGAALASGELTRTFSSTGLDPVDLTTVLARHDPPAAGASRGAARTSSHERPRDEAAIARARQRLEASEVAARAAAAAAHEARLAAVSASRRHEDLRAGLAEVRARLADLERAEADATEAEDAARRAQLAATRHERSAVEEAERARRSLDALLDPGRE